MGRLQHNVSLWCADYFELPLSSSWLRMTYITHSPWLSQEPMSMTSWYVCNETLFFSPFNMSHVNLILRSARRTLRDRGNFFLLTKAYCINKNFSYGLFFYFVSFKFPKPILSFGVCAWNAQKLPAGSVSEK